jgi:hypothetical protein
MADGPPQPIHQPSLISEFAEGCCSQLRYLEKCNKVGRDVSLARLCGATSLRVAGLRGDLLDLPVLYVALEQHFRGGCWHFRKQTPLHDSYRGDISNMLPF